MVLTNAVEKVNITGMLGGSILALPHSLQHILQG